MNLSQEHEIRVVVPDEQFSSRTRISISRLADPPLRSERSIVELRVRDTDVNIRKELFAAHQPGTFAVRRVTGSASFDLNT